MYVYLRSEPGLWTVGYYDPSGKWVPESDHNIVDEAAKRVAKLNGSPIEYPDKSNSDAVIRFMYFVYNFHHDWIEDVWKDNQHMARHIREKFRGKHDRLGPSHGFIDLFMELSDDHKRTLVDWIENNYKGYKGRQKYLEL